MPPKSSNTDSAENGQEPQDAPKPHEDVPACQSCRKKKARCSREQPCSECIRFNVDCVYDERRMKPGLRAGAVDQLYRRIETLENMFLGQEILWQTMWRTLYPNDSLPEPSERPANITSLAQRREELKFALLQASSIPDRRGEQRNGDAEPVSRPAKRPRCESTTLPAFVDTENEIDGLLSTDVMTELVDFYFVNIHPWIPVLHVARFRERVKSPDERPRITCILHAIIAVCARFSQSESLRDEEKKAKIAEQSRQKVILDSTESFSVENLQALVIIAFETVGSLSFTF
jgi:malate synthase